MIELILAILAAMVIWNIGIPILCIFIAVLCNGKK